MKQTLTQFCIVLIDSDAWITGMGKGDLGVCLIYMLFIKWKRDVFALDEKSA